jgi:hypothetical protein
MASTRGNINRRPQVPPPFELPPVAFPVHPDLQAFNGYLSNTLGIMAPDVIGALNEQGLISFESFIGLESDDLTTIAMNIRKPGGTIQNPNEARREEIPSIPNPGISIGFVSVRRLEYLRFYVHHCIRVQRPLIAAEMSVARLTNIYKLKETEDSLKKETVELPEKILKIDDVRNNIEDLDDYLMRKRGESGLPLAYVTRDTVEPPVDDPGFGLPTSLVEMVDRGNHNQPAFQNDSIEVFNVIRHMTHGGLAWSWVSAFNRNKDGRNAYIALKSHYLGESYQARIKAAADAVLTKTYYDGQRSFSFEQYISVLQKAFTDMESTGEEVAEDRKIRILLDGITASNLQVAVGIIRADRSLKSSYELAVNYLAETHDTNKSASTGRRNVSSVATGHGKKGTPKGKANKKNKNAKTKFLKASEWWSLTEAQRSEIRRSRSQPAATQSVQQVVTGVVTDVSAVPAAAAAASTQSVGALMTRRNTGN